MQSALLKHVGNDLVREISLKLILYNDSSMQLDFYQIKSLIHLVETNEVKNCLITRSNIEILIDILEPSKYIAHGKTTYKNVEAIE